MLRPGDLSREFITDLTETKAALENIERDLGEKIQEDNCRASRFDNYTTD